MIEMKIDNRENFVIGIFLGLLIPLITDVLFWWTAASLDIFNIVAIPEKFVAISAITGLIIGVLLDILYLKSWIKKFYVINKTLSILLYLFCSLIAVACFMGVPIGNLFLGFLAGIYIGRKSYHWKSDLPRFESAARRVSLFCATVTSVEALFIGLLVLREVHIIENIHRVLRLAAPDTYQIADVLLIVMLSAILFGVQFVITRFGARLAFSKILQQLLLWN